MTKDAIDEVQQQLEEQAWLVNHLFHLINEIDVHPAASPAHQDALVQARDLRRAWKQGPHAVRSS